MARFPGLVGVSVASGKGGVKVLDPTDCPLIWRKSVAQRVLMGLREMHVGRGATGDDTEVLPSRLRSVAIGVRWWISSNTPSSSC